MLDLAQLVSKLGELAGETQRRQQERESQLLSALEIASRAPQEWAVLRDRIEHADTTWLTAKAIDENPIGHQIAAPPALPTYTVIATDGSQIPLDRHAAALCYVLNVGEVVIHYGTGERPRLRSKADLYYHDADLFVEGDTGEPGYINDQTLATRRMLAECDAMMHLLDSHENHNEAIALLDGTLILWTQEAERAQERSQTIAAFMNLLNAARGRQIPIAGYLSRPGSREVVNALRIALCPDTPVLCRPCPYESRPCNALNRVVDAALFARLLRPGERSGLFESRSRVLDSYEHDQRIAFFYVNVESEVARVEVPLWVAQSAELIERTHALILDQARKGRGYPIALLEAHEQAIVRGPDREDFIRLVENCLIRNNLPVLHSRKGVAKRIRTI